MNLSNECVYHLIPRAQEVVAKPPMYRSRHNNRLPPSCSTFGISNTTRALNNESGGNDDQDAQFDKKAHATFGREVVADIHPERFLKKGQSTLPPVQPKRFVRPAAPEQPRKSGVPQRQERPVMGLTTEKNFIVANAVDNILAVPKKATAPKALHMTSRKAGKVPKYLTSIKQEIAAENEYIQRLQQNNQQAENDQMQPMSEEAKAEIVAGLKRRWDEIHKAYQALTFNVDSVNKVQRKEGLEVEMEQIEKAIQKLTKKTIFIYNDMNPYSYY
eukprot:NODE_783_length_1353_cov_70.443252_g572_i0.p1 GENE.NODE_783_length_1353_cov_70.443252_g572_i0~~NODE_783_length_1353_cov_70.443252_g572_i0.p1  ORF type:complete len:273 (+),score=61.08 NODE_783_length_1353_cov_70.443252_g572_i0:70-888(+)